MNIICIYTNEIYKYTRKRAFHPPDVAQHSLQYDRLYQEGS